MQKILFNNIKTKSDLIINSYFNTIQKQFHQKTIYLVQQNYSIYFVVFKKLVIIWLSICFY